MRLLARGAAAKVCARDCPARVATFAWGKPCASHRLRELRAGSPIFAEKNRSEALWNILFFRVSKALFFVVGTPSSQGRLPCVFPVDRREVRKNAFPFGESSSDRSFSAKIQGLAYKTRICPTAGSPTRLRARTAPSPLPCAAKMPCETMWDAVSHPKKQASRFTRLACGFLVPPIGFEPTALGLGNRCSIP